MQVYKRTNLYILRYIIFLSSLSKKEITLLHRFVVPLNIELIYSFFERQDIYKSSLIY